MTKLELTGKVTISNFDGKVTFYFDKLNPKGPTETSPSGIIEYSSNLGLEIWQKFKSKVVKITVEQIEDWDKNN